MAKNREKPEKTKKKRISKYWFVLLALVIINAIAIGIVWNWVRGVLVDFEAHTPRRAIETYFTQLEQSDRQTIMDTATFVPDEQNSWDDYFAILDSRFDGVTFSDISWRQTMSTTLAEGEQMYSIYKGEDKLGTVVLTPNDSYDTGWAVRSDVDYLPGYTIESVPAGVQVYQNGTPLPMPANADTPVLITYERDGRPVEVDIFGTLSDESLIPKMTAPFETEPTLREPEFAATDWNGNPCDVVVDAEARTVTATVPVASDVRDALAAYMEEVAHTYSDFITYELKGRGLSLLLPYVYEGSSLYNDFKGYEAYWYRDHESRTFSESTFSDIVMHSNTCFTGRIEFTVTIVRLGTTHIFEPSYDMAFIQQDGEWKLAGLHARRAVGNITE